MVDGNVNGRPAKSCVVMIQSSNGDPVADHVTKTGESTVPLHRTGFRK